MVSLLCVIGFAILCCLHGINAAYLTPDCDPILRHYGCYYNPRDTHESTLLITDRERDSPIKIDWNNYPTYLTGLVCRCTKIAQAQGYVFIGIHYWGECWGYKTKHGSLHLRFATDCQTVRYTSPCEETTAKYCTGTVSTASIYRILSMDYPVNGGYSGWSGWSECSKQCGGGMATRVRSCNNPLPSSTGVNCAGLGPSEEAKPCNEAACSPKFPYPNKHCGTVSHENGIDTLFASLPYNRTVKYCRVIYPKTTADDASYIMTVRMFNNASTFDPFSGSTGIIFNAQDLNNFQFVYLRLNGELQCHVSGVVRNGHVDVWSGPHTECKHGTLSSRKWITLMLQMTNDGASVSADGLYMTTIRNVLPKKAKGGVMAKNGEENVVMFKDYSIFNISYH